MTLQGIDKRSGKTTMSGTSPGKEYLPVFMIEVQNKKHGLIVYRSTIPDFYVDVVSKFFVKNIEDRKSTRSELQSHHDLVCRLLLEKKKTTKKKKQ